MTAESEPVPTAEPSAEPPAEPPTVPDPPASDDDMPAWARSLTETVEQMGRTLASVVERQSTPEPEPVPDEPPRRPWTHRGLFK